MSIDTSRGAYMKAVGLVVKPTKSTGACGNVWKHKNFLMQELRYNIHKERERDQVADHFIQSLYDPISVRRTNTV